MVQMAEMDGGIAVIQTSSAPIGALVDGSKLLETHPMSPQAESLAREFITEVTEEIMRSTGQEPILITAEDVAKKVQKVDSSLAGIPMVVLGENFFEGLRDQTKVLWNAPLASLTMSRGFLPTLSSKPIGYLPVAGTSSEKRPEHFKPPSTEVVIGDDNASANASTLRKAAGIIQKNGADVKAFVVGFYAGAKRTDEGDYTKLDGKPLIAVKTRFASPSHQRFILEHGKKRRPSIETIDLGFFPGSGQGFVQGYPEAEEALKQISLLLFEFSARGGRSDVLSENIQALGAYVRDKQALSTYIKRLEEPMSVEHIIPLFTQSEVHGEPILSIQGLDFTAIDPRRVPRVWPGTKEMPQSLWDLFTVEAWERFSDRMLTLNIELLKNIYEITGRHVETRELPFLLLPDVQRMISRPHLPMHAIDALRSLKTELDLSMKITT